MEGMQIHNTATEADSADAILQEKQTLVNPTLDALVLSKYRHLLDDPWVRRFYYDKCRKSIKTGKSYMKTLGRVMLAMGCTPSSFIALEQDEREGLLIDFLEALSAEGRSDGYVDTTEAIIKSWMAWRRVPMMHRTNRRRNPENSRNATTVIPSRDQLRTLMRTCSLRAKFITACVAYSAMRPMVLSDQDQRDGLRFRDLPEVHIVDGKVIFDAIPTLVKVRWNLSKNEQAYPTFWPQETCAYFKDLTEQRFREGEDIAPDSLVFPPTMGSPAGFLGELQLHLLMREPMNKAGLTDATPYTWKSYCIDGLTMAEREPGGLTREQRKLIVGHECGLHADYALRKSDLTPDTKEAIRRAYESAAAKYLEAFPEVKQENRAANGSAGPTLAPAAPSTLASAVAATALNPPASPRVLQDSPPTMYKPRQRLATLQQLETLLLEGWIFVRELSDGRVLVSA